MNKKILIIMFLLGGFLLSTSLVFAQTKKALEKAPEKITPSGLSILPPYYDYFNKISDRLDSIEKKIEQILTAISTGGKEIPVPPIPPPPPSGCAAGFELRGASWCYNSLSGRIYRLGETEKASLLLSEWARKYIGTSINCPENSIRLNAEATNIFCDKTGIGVVYNRDTWTRVNWTNTLWSYVSPSVTSEETEKARKIVTDGCPNATQSTVSWNQNGLPISCTPGQDRLETTIGTQTGGGGGTSSLTENWKTCFSDEGKKAGAAQADIDNGLTLIKNAIANRIEVPYSQINSVLYSVIANCERATNVYLSNLTSQGNRGTTNYYNYGFSSTEKECMRGKGIPETVIADMEESRRGTYISDSTRQQAMSQWGAQAGSCFNYYSGGGGGGSAGRGRCQSGYHETSYVVPGGSTTWQGCSADYGNNCTTLPDANNQTQNVACPWPAGGSTSGGTGGGAYSSCPSDVSVLLGEGCHQMYTDSTNQQIYCNGQMSISAKAGDTQAKQGCVSPTSARPSFFAQIFSLFGFRTK